ncbi:pseudomonalisin precursor [mine drainage metagenome]|uniref:Pseudomonalisin n=1 Tax=mine drainage metagenome TaxID=410659 RepID=A0A1J5R3H6_9ZZZZ
MRFSALYETACSCGRRVAVNATIAILGLLSVMPVVKAASALGKGNVIKPVVVSAISAPAGGIQAAQNRRYFDASIIPVATQETRGLGHVIRAALGSQQMEQTIRFSIALKMRNLDGLRALTASGRRVSQSVMEANYLPKAADYAAVVTWLKTQGFTIIAQDPNHTVVFAEGTVSLAAKVFGVTFSVVSSGGSEFTSAVTAPSLPTDQGLPLDAILGIDGLQPNLRARPNTVGAPLKPLAVSQPISTNPGLLAPVDIANAYHADASLTGSGQTIAILIDAMPTLSDLTAFWNSYGSNQSISRYSVVTVNGGPLTILIGGIARDQSEATLDVDWAGGIAPGASIRLYAVPSLMSSDLQLGCTQLLSDLASHPSIHELSISVGSPESHWAPASIQALSQTLAQLAANGVTIVVASGDSGSNPNTNGTNGYSASNPLDVEYPASDPSVLAVGGTNLQLNQDGSVASEKSWSLSGGGYSQVFARPSWQVGPGVPTGSSGTAMRCVPDVAAVAAASGTLQLTQGGTTTTGEQAPYIILNGVPKGYGGTSLSAPVWAGVVALVNQARSNNNLAALGFANAAFYSFKGTAPFTDVISGSNGAYDAGSGYDLCTGLGVPNITELVAHGVNEPSIIQQPVAQSVEQGKSVSFSVQATGANNTYQWYLNGKAISGANLESYTIATVQPADTGDYSVSVENAYGRVTSDAVALTFIVMPVITTQPVGLDDLTSAQVALSVTAQGGQLTYQWRLNGKPITGATGSTYIVTNPSAGGSYDVVVSNVVGSVTSTAVQLRPSQGFAFADYAGRTGQPGSQDGQRMSASFGALADVVASNTNPYLFNGRSVLGVVGPTAVAIDSVGNVYVADTGNHIIRKISTSGMVTTVAGIAGKSGASDGSALSATFNGPSGIVVDSSGNLYVADTGNDTIREIAVNGTVSTIAGAAGLKGAVDGTGSHARFNLPYGLALAADGSIYVADAGNDAIRRISPGGVVSTIAGMLGISGAIDGVGSSARFNFPMALSFDGQGRLWVADTGNDAIRMVTADAVVSTVAGVLGKSGIVDGAALQASFNGPSGIAADSSGNCYIADTKNHTIRYLSTAGIVSTLGGMYNRVTDGSGIITVAAGITVTGIWGIQGAANGIGSAAMFSDVTGIALDASNRIYVCDSSNCTIRVGMQAVSLAITQQPQGVTVNPGATATFSVKAQGSGTLNYQWYLDGIALSDGNEYSGASSSALTIANVQVRDAGNYSVQVTTSVGPVADAGEVASSSGELVVAAAPQIVVQPQDIEDVRQAAEFSVAAQGSGLSYKWSTNAIFKSDPTKPYFYVNGPPDETPTVQVVVSNAYGSVTSRVAKYQTIQGYAIGTLAGQMKVEGYQDGNAKQARFNNPTSAVADGAGNVYVADYGNRVIRKIGPDGTVSTFAGLAGSSGSVDGTGSNARFTAPCSLAIDGNGNLYVADMNCTIRKITPAGLVSTLAGKAGEPGAADGSGSAARFNFGGLSPNGGGYTIGSFFFPGIVTDATGNVYVADSANGTVRKITPDGVVTTIAGQAAIFGYRDGPARDARFGCISYAGYVFGPTGVAVDGQGNVYVADYGNGCLRRIDTGGEVSTIASLSDDGTYVAIYSGGAISTSLAIDSAGNLYFNRGAYTIGKITPQGVTTTLGGDYGANDGVGLAAGIGYIYGVSSDPAGTLYFADSHNETIRIAMAAETPSITTQPVSLSLNPNDEATFSVAAQVPKGTLSYQWYKDGVELVDGSNLSGTTTAQLTINHVRLSDVGAYTVSVQASVGVVQDAGSVTSAAAQLDVSGPPQLVLQPQGQGDLSGEIVLLSVSAWGSGLAYQWRLNGQAIPGATGSSYASTVGTQGYYDVVVSNTLGNVVSEPVSLSVVQGYEFTTFAGRAGVSGNQDGGRSDALLANPSGLAFDSKGNLYVADSGNDNVRKMAPDGTITTLPFTLYEPEGIAIDASDNLYVTDSFGAYRISPGGTKTTLYSQNCDGIAVDSLGNVYVAQAQDGVVMKIAPDGTNTIYAGVSGRFGYRDGLASTALFGRIFGGLAIDSSGNVFLADTSNGAIRKIAPDGTVSTFAGGGSRLGADGSGTNALFDQPQALAVDAGGNLWVVDQSRICMVTAAGVVQTIAGVLFQPGYADGVGSDARFNFVGGGHYAIGGIAFDARGAAYVSDGGNDVIRKGTAAGAGSSGPVIMFQPLPSIVRPGESAQFSISTSGQGSCAWQVSTDSGKTWVALADGGPYSGTKTDTLSISAATDAMDGWEYACLVTDSSGSVTSSPVGLSVLESAVSLSALSEYNPNAKIIAISTRSWITPDATQTAGIIIKNPAGGTNKASMLFRAGGPALETYLSNFLPDPNMTLYNLAGTVLDQNDNWGSNSNAASLQATADALGEYPFAGGSKDAALLESLSPGAYTSIVDGHSGSGVDLVEAYDANPKIMTGPRLVAISTRSWVDAGTKSETAGFIIEGSGLKTILIRADGPSLSAQNVSSPLQDPLLTLYDVNGKVLATNDNWGDNTNSADIVAAAAAVGEFPFTTGSKDAALLVTLPAGIYTATVTPKDGTPAGDGMVEVYEVK